MWLLLLLFWFSLPGQLFKDPSSTILLDRGGQLAGARIAADYQWRFPDSEEIPEKFGKSILVYEDKYFAWHPGFNPVSFARALALNARNGRVVSGGSTITMQVIRLSRKNKPRTIGEKIIETILAFRMELTYSKREILKLYISHAPFGGNVVGLDAASWRYFGRRAEELSWAEAATLAVLPNNPGMIYPGRNPAQLLDKRNRLLDRLCDEGVIDRTTCDLAKSETLPLRPKPLPQSAPQLLSSLSATGMKGKRIYTTLDLQVQETTREILERHAALLGANEIYNAAAIVVEVNTGNVLAYVGNLPQPDSRKHGNDVDIIRSPRSTGSILKPLLYAAMLNDGLLLPNTLIPDVPTQIGGFFPKNYNLTYEGAVPAKRALSRSLNIPAVKMLQTYGYEPFYAFLRRLGLTTLKQPAGHYGLTLILGGAEANLWDLSGIYASMGRTLNHYNRNGGYSKHDFHPPAILARQDETEPEFTEPPSILDAASVWLAFEAMVEVSRPDEDLMWQYFSSARKIAWKTGTSFGNRDAWAIGVTPGYVVAVWVGNASGEGRPGLTGISAAAPVMFDIFSSLPSTTWFTEPSGELVSIPVCRYSGYRATPLCEFVDTIKVQKQGLRTAACPYHQLIHLDMSGQYQVNSSCESPSQMTHVSWFVLPPVMEWYFRTRNPFYRILPPYRPGCTPGNQSRSMEMIYPKNNSRMYIPVDLGGKMGSTVFKAAHRNPEATVYWYLDEQFLGSTRSAHQMALSPASGMHTLTLVDQQEERVVVNFEILKK